MLVKNPYETLESDDSEPPTKGDLTERSIQNFFGLLVMAGLVAFIATPGICVLAWLLGYGTGGMNELMSGYPIRGMLTGSFFISPIHCIAFLRPRQRKAKVIGYAVGIPMLIYLSWIMQNHTW